LFKRTLVNRQIRSPKIRLIDENGEQLGVVFLDEALRISQERNLDLVQVTDKAEPPVCKIMSYGKYLYLQEKKRKKEIKTGTLKGIRIGFNISRHDLETKANLVEKFLKKGDKVKIEMFLRGREKMHEDFARQKISEFFEILKNQMPFKIEKNLQKRGSNFTVIVSK